MSREASLDCDHLWRRLASARRDPACMSRLHGQTASGPATPYDSTVYRSGDQGAM